MHGTLAIRGARRQEDKPVPRRDECATDLDIGKSVGMRLGRVERDGRTAEEADSPARPALIIATARVALAPEHGVCGEAGVQEELVAVAE